MVAIVESANLDAIPPDAKSLRTWIDSVQELRELVSGNV
jgi:hypothetical protein